MLLIVGLGNPGPRFENTRHNVGFDVARRVSTRLDLTLRKRFLRPYLWARSTDVVVVLPLTYMNRSGRILPSLMRATGAEVGDLVVVCDNMDLSPGVARIKRKGSSRSHNGIASIMDALGTGEFTRLYVGVGRPETPSGVVEHVLSAPPEAEAALYDRAEERACEALIALAVEHYPLDRVINGLNAGDAGR
ncbi:MAG: aminoacyl-tRNA hydrolase [Spirochaetota bacterium]